MDGDVADASDARSQGWLCGRQDTQREDQQRHARCDSATHWGNFAWAIGADGKARRVKPGVRLLAHGVPARVGRLRAYGNAIVPQVAAEVIAAFMESRP
jgi:DNA (cytosine-5)-methyltransferase 1